MVDHSLYRQRTEKLDKSAQKINTDVETDVLDGDNLRHGLNKDIGFSKDERKENIRRVAEVANLFCDAGILTICSFVSPYTEDRQYAKGLVDESEFVEVFVKCPLEVCLERDPKSMYKKAVSGKMKSFTGIDGPYEHPESPDITIESDRLNLTESVDRIIEHLDSKGIICTSPVADSLEIQG
ncbi:MAG: adenylyl-sulfate kinase [Nitrospirota bacterium]